MSFEAKELAFWKAKIVATERERVESERAVWRHEMSLPKRRRVISVDVDPDGPIENIWLDNEFEVVAVSFEKGDGLVQIGEYTTDYDSDVYSIEIRWVSGPQAGRPTNYTFSLDDSDFRTLLREALAFEVKP